MRWDIEGERLQYGGALGDGESRLRYWGLRGRGKMEEFCDACHLGEAKMVFATKEALPGSNTANVVLKMKLCGESGTLLHHTVTVHGNEQRAAVSRVQTNVHILGGRGGPHRAAIVMSCSPSYCTHFPLFHSNSIM